MPKATYPATLDEFSGFVTRLLDANQQKYHGSMEDYLRAVLSSATHYSSEPPSYAVLARILEEAFIVEPAPWDDRWSAQTTPPENPWLLNRLAIKMFPDVYTPARLAALEAMRSQRSEIVLLQDTLIFLIADFHSMTSQQLEYKWRYLGTDSPRGNIWNNWDPFTFLECALAGFTAHVEQGHVVGTTETACGWAAMALFLDLGRVYE